MANRLKISPPAWLTSLQLADLLTVDYKTNNITYKHIFECSRASEIELYLLSFMTFPVSLSGISSTQARENIFVPLAKVSVAESVNKGVDAVREKCQQRENTIYRTIYVDVSCKCKEEKDSTWSIAND